MTQPKTTRLRGLVQAARVAVDPAVPAAPLDPAAVTEGLTLALGADPRVVPLTTAAQWERELGDVPAGKRKALAARFGAGWAQALAAGAVRLKEAAQAPYAAKLAEARAFVQAVDMLLPLGPSAYVQPDELPAQIQEMWRAAEAPHAWARLAGAYGPNWVAALPDAWRAARREGFKTKTDRGGW